MTKVLAHNTCSIRPPHVHCPSFWLVPRTHHNASSGAATFSDPLVGAWRHDAANMPRRPSRHARVGYCRVCPTAGAADCRSWESPPPRDCSLTAAVFRPGCFGRGAGPAHPAPVPQQHAMRPVGEGLRWLYCPRREKLARAISCLCDDTPNQRVTTVSGLAFCSH
eukprot:scaffold56691_cov89-Phaeocystis_antarctica.AAC.3